MEPSLTGKYALRRDTAPDVYEAFRAAVYTYGVPELAKAMGLRPGTLYNKADAGDESHNQPTLRDAVLVTSITGDMRIVEALAESFGRSTFDVLSFTEASDQALLELVTKLGQESGEFHAALHEGLAARQFDMRQLRVIRAEAMDIVSALMTLVARVEGYVDAPRGC